MEITVIEKDKKLEYDFSHIEPKMVTMGKIDEKLGYLINITTNTLRLVDRQGAEIIVFPCGEVINKKLEEQQEEIINGATIVSLNYNADDRSNKLIEYLEEKYPSAIILGNLADAQAFKGRVFAVTMAKGYEYSIPSMIKFEASKFVKFK